MKKAFEIIIAVKYTAAMAFTGMIALYLVFSDWLLGEIAIPHAIVWQALFLALLIAALQYICFTDHVLKNISNMKRVALFAVKSYATFSFFAVLFHWFPMTTVNWIIYTGVFLLIAIILGVVFGVYFKVTGNKYNQMLDAYQSRQRS